MNQQDATKLRIEILTSQIDAWDYQLKLIEQLIPYYCPCSELYQRLESDKYRITGLILDTEIRINILKSQ